MSLDLWRVTDGIGGAASVVFFRCAGHQGMHGWGRAGTATSFFQRRLDDFAGGRFGAEEESLRVMEMMRVSDVQSLTNILRERAAQVSRCLPEVSGVCSQSGSALSFVDLFFIRLS